MRERGLAMAEAAAQQSRLDGRDPRARGRGGRDALPPILGVWPANYNCPGQIVVSGENLRRRRVHRAGAGGRRAPRGQAQGLGRVPLAARRARRRPAAARRSRRCSSRSRRRRSCRPSRRASSRRSGWAPLLVDQLTAPVRFTQAATELMKDGVSTFVEVGPGNVLSGLVQADRPQRQGRLGQQPRVARQAARSARRNVSFASLEGKTALVTGASRGIGRAIAEELAARRRRGRRSATAPARTRPRRSRASSAGAPSRPTSRTPRTPRGSSRRRATSTSSSTTPASRATGCSRACPTTTGAP